MKKLKLEALSVDTFSVTEGEPQPRGTVRGHTGWDLCGWQNPEMEVEEGDGTTLDGYLTQFCTDGGSPCC
jgi:hypothetical protein